MNLSREPDILILSKLSERGGDFTNTERLEVIKNSFPQVIEQLKYNIKRFTHLLLSIGYDQESAFATAENICLKPLLYSLIPRILSSHDPSEILQKLGSRDNLSYLEEIFISLLPEMVVYLFDETTDEFMKHQTVQDNMVANLIENASEELIEKPYFYLHLLLNAIDEFERKGNPEESSNVFYRLLYPYLEWVTKLGVDLRTIIQQISDVITNEHRAQLLHRNPSVQEAKAYSDFISLIEMESITNPNVDSKREQANSILTNQGLLLVVMNSLIFNKSDAVKDFGNHFIRSEEVKKFILNLMALVRIADDFSDMQIDRVNNVINIFLADEEIKEHFIALSGLEADTLINFVLIDRSTIEDFSNITHIDCIAELIALYKKCIEANSKDINPDLLEAIKGVIYAAIVNAEFSDKAITQFTHALKSQD